MEKADTLIHGCTILPMNDEGLIEDGALLIKNGKIVFVGKSDSIRNADADVVINARGKIVLPGLINCHTHVPMTLFRGIAEDQPLETWLKKTIWPLEAKLKREDIYYGGLLGCLEMLKSGTTCFADMYFHEDMVAKAVKEIGLRGVLAEGIIESGNKLRGKKMLEKSVDFAQKFNGHSDGRIRAMLGPHAVYSCSPDLLVKIKEKAFELGVGVHLHLAESKEMLRDFEEKHGVSETTFLDNIEFLGGSVLAAHCINLSKWDMHIFSKNRVNVVYVPVANMKLGLGAAKIKDLTDLGVNVCLGTDGPACNNSLDMFDTMKIAALLQKHAYHDPSVLPANEIVRMATINGAKALGLNGEIGSLEVGKKADLILIDVSKPHLKPLHSVFASLVYSARGSDVDTVIVDGKILMENQQVKVIDEQAVMEKAEQAALDLLSR